MKNSHKKSLPNEDCPKCGNIGSVGVWQLEDGSLQKYCFTVRDGVTCGKLDGSTIITQPGFDVDEDYLAATSFRSEVVKNYSITQDGLKFYFGRREPSGKLHSVLCRDYSFQKRENGHWKWLGNGSNLLFYGMHTVNTENIIITEGYWDAVAAYQITGISAVSVPNGCGSAIASIRHNWTWLKQFTNVFIIFDNDEQGVQTSNEVVKIIGHRAKQVILPSYTVQLEHKTVVTKDSFDFLKFKLESVYIRSLEAAKNAPSQYVLDDSIDAVYAEYVSNPDYLKGWSTGISELDDLCTFRPHESTALLGSPGRGKSSLCRYFSFEIIMQGKKAFFLALEEPPEKVISSFAQLFGIVGEPSEVASKVRELVMIGKIPSFMSPETLHDMLESVIIQGGAQFIVIDHLTWLIETENDPVKAARKYLHVITQVCKDYPVHILAVSHNRPRDEAIAAKSKRELSPDWEEYTEPTIRDGQWSTGIGQLFWNIWGWRKPNAPSEPGRLYVIKSRSGGLEKLSKVMLYFDSGKKFISAGKYYAKSKKHNKGNASIRREEHPIRGETGKDSAGEVLSSDSQVSTLVRSVPEQFVQGRSDTTGSALHQGEETDNNDTSNARDTQVPDNEIHGNDTRFLLSSNGNDNRNQRADDGRVSTQNRGFQASASLLVQTLQNSLPKPRPESGKMPLLPVGRETGDTVVPLQPDEEGQYSDDNSSGLVLQDPSIFRMFKR